MFLTVCSGGGRQKSGLNGTADNSTLLSDFSMTMTKLARGYRQSCSNSDYPDLCIPSPMIMTAVTLVMADRAVDIIYRTESGGDR
jgi:hypothetical protein